MVAREVPVFPDSSDSIAVAPITSQPVRLTSSMESKLNGYILHHNEYSASTRMKGVLPYTRIVSYTPGKRLSR